MSKFDDKKLEQLEDDFKKTRKPKKYRQIKYSDLSNDSENEKVKKADYYSDLFDDMSDFIIDEDEDDMEDTLDKTSILKSQDDSSENNVSFLYDDNDKTLDLSDILSSRDLESSKSKKMRLWQKLLVAVICLCVMFGSGLAFLLYGPYPKFREWLITTAMTTMNHQYLAKWFYSDKTIENVLKKNYVVESSEDTDTNQVKFVDYNKLKVMYKNKYEREILTKDDDNDLYKLININDSGMRGYLVVIYDPSKVKIATATNMNSYGEMLTDMVKKNDAVIGMNASGFYDPNYNGNGGRPYGIVIKKGKVVSNLEKPNVGGGIIGFTKDNKLVLGKMTVNEALQKGIRDAVEFGPYLIVNGTPSFIKGNGGWGTAPRSAIAQRQDGIVLFLVMDGRDYSHGIDGVGMVELTEILMKYGAYNASNLDGGTSSGLVIDGKIINKPVNSSGQKKTRKIPDAWIVTE